MVAAPTLSKGTIVAATATEQQLSRALSRALSGSTTGITESTGGVGCHVRAIKMRAVNMRAVRMGAAVASCHTAVSVKTRAATAAATAVVMIA